MTKGCGCGKTTQTKEEYVKRDAYFKDFSSLEKELVAENLGFAGKVVNIENHADEEDLTEVSNGTEIVLKFKDKKYDPRKQSGLGRKFLRKNLKNRGYECGELLTNILEQKMFEDCEGNPLTNTIFIIQYDYDLDGQFINIPEDSILLFLGGSFTNGNIVFNKTQILPQALDFDTVFNCKLLGKVKEGQIRYSCGELQYWDGKVWKGIGSTTIYTPYVTPSKSEKLYTIYYGTSDKETIELSDIKLNFNKFETTLVDSPLTRFDNKKYIYWVIPDDIKGRISVYTDGIRNTDIEDFAFNIDNMPYTAYKINTPQSDRVESQLKVIGQ